MPIMKKCPHCPEKFWTEGALQTHLRMCPRRLRRFDTSPLRAPEATRWQKRPAESDTGPVVVEDSSDDLLDPLNPLGALSQADSTLLSDPTPDFTGGGGGDFGGGGAGGDWGSDSSTCDTSSSSDSDSYDSGSSSDSSSCDSGSTDSGGW